MSGIIGSKLNIRSSGRIATLGTDGQVLISSGAGTEVAFEDAAAGISWQAVETGSNYDCCCWKWLSNRYKFKTHVRLHCQLLLIMAIK